MAQQDQATRTASFFDHLKQVLESIDEPERLGRQSPLAAPYFLGGATRQAEPSPRGRGEVLCAEVRAAIVTMWGDPLPADGQAMLRAVAEEGNRGDRYDCLILELNYLKQRYRPAPRSQSEIYNDILHISRPTHDRHLRAAVERLGTLLLQRLQPAVRPEKPVLPELLVGRGALVARAFADLAAGKTVSLTGAGGVGKTSLGASLADQWTSPALFWYTFRPTFNDQLDSLLYSLGHFLHLQGGSTLWHQLIADGGRIKDVNLALGLALGDLAGLRYRPLLCFDELDFLRPLTQDQARPQHVQLLEFLDSLRGHTALLLIGQRAFWESDAVYAMDALTQAQLAELLAARSIPHTQAEGAALFATTGGNPRLVELCIAFYQAGTGERLAEALDELPKSQTLLPLWHRLERRLPAAERRLIYALSVFRSPAPADAWQDGASERAEALAQLVQRRLVHQDGRGGVALLPALRELIYGELAVELREQLHQQAAAIRAGRGEYTAAAYHLQQANQLEAAVSLWYPVRAGEINRGQAGAALAIFAEISQRRLAGPRRRELLLLRSELYQLRGEPEKVIENLAQEPWPADEEASVDAALLWGKALDIQGRAEAAIQQQAAGIATATRLLDKLTQLYVQRSLSHLHERNLAPAWHQVNLASHYVATMKGALHEQSGNLDGARAFYQDALTIAETLAYRSGMAKVHHHLGNLAVRQLDVDQAMTHYRASMAIYAQLGDLVGSEVVRSGMAAGFMQMGRYQEAIEPAQQALAFFERMNDSFWIALNASNLAESSFEMGNLDAAEAFAQRVLAQEEPHSHPYALFTLGRTRMAQQRGAEAALYLAQARKVAEQNDDTYLLAYIGEELARLYVAQGDGDAAREAASLAVAHFERLGIQTKAAEVKELLSNLDASSPERDASGNP